MRVVALLLIALGLSGGYTWWRSRTATAAAATASPTGFVPVAMPDGAPRDTVLILAPPDCPSEQARRAEALARELVQQGIPVVRSGGMSFQVTDPSWEQRQGIERAVSVFNAGAPAVFINGMAMSDPSPAQAIAEFRRTRL